MAMSLEEIDSVADSDVLVEVRHVESPHSKIVRLPNPVGTVGVVRSTTSRIGLEEEAYLEAENEYSWRQ